MKHLQECLEHEPQYQQEHVEDEHHQEHVEYEYVKARGASG